MRVMTWNINSVRLRLPLLQELLAETKPDMIALQETKVEDTLFPLQDIQSLGYPHVAFRGMKSYNGVAIISKIPFIQQGYQNFVGREDTRHIWAECENGITLHNFYVPAGGDIPDRHENEKFGHKLDFVDEMADYFKTNYRKEDKLILVGDLNIAPLEQDVWSHKQLLKIVSHTPIEVEKLNHAMTSFGWHDVMRKFVPDDKKLYSWWSYRGRDWEKSDRGRRLDHIWATPPLGKAAQQMQVMKSYRGKERPSDHAPVFVDFNLL